MIRIQENSGLLLHNTRRAIELPFQPEFHKNYHTLTRNPYSPTQLISLKMKKRFPREIFGPNRNLKSKQTSVPQITPEPILYPEINFGRQDIFKKMDSSPSLKSNNALADTKKLRIDCAQIFKEEEFLPEIKVKPQVSSNYGNGLISSSRIINNVKNAFYFNNNSIRNLYIRPVLKRREIIPKLPPEEGDVMRETAHFLMESQPSTQKQGIPSAPPKMTKEQRAMRELKVMQKQPVKTTEKKTFRRKYKQVKKVQDKRESVMEVTFSKE